jgi:hypothetical protein
MLTRFFTPVLLSFISFLSSSCDKSACENTNPKFDKFSIGSKEYKSELAKQIRRIGSENLSYWFDKYLKKDGQEFIIVDIQGRELCAKGEIQVYEWAKISGMRRASTGFHGAELKGLQIEIKENSTGTNFIYINVDRVID